jgi:hypothetical protein
MVGIPAMPSRGGSHEGDQTATFFTNDSQMADRHGTETVRVPVSFPRVPVSFGIIPRSASAGRDGNCPGTETVRVPVSFPTGERKRFFTHQNLGRIVSRIYRGIAICDAVDYHRQFDEAGLLNY